MEIIGFLVVIVAVVIVALVRNHKEDQKTIEGLQSQLVTEKKANAEKQSADGQQVVIERRSRDLFLETLAKMGCQYELDDDDRICFHWQGGSFVVSASNESVFVTVWYFQWGEWELYDIDMLSRVKRVINDANICYSLNVVYSINEEGGSFFIHSNKSFLFIPQIPDIKGYLEAMLGEFFIVRRYVEKELDKLENQEEKISK